MYYLFLPLAIFLCSWAKLWIGIPLTILLGIAPIFMLKDVRGETVPGSLRQETTVFFVLLIWVVLSGIGGYVWQNRRDHFFRNAVFMDLVERPWPVQSDGNALVYYLGFWLPSALVAKLTHSLETGYLMQLVYEQFDRYRLKGVRDHECQRDAADITVAYTRNSGIHTFYLRSNQEKP